MTGPELRAIRQRLGLSVESFGRALGYQGQPNTVSVSVRRYEAPNGRPIPPWIARLATMFDRHGVPPEFMAAPCPIQMNIALPSRSSSVSSGPDKERAAVQLNFGGGAAGFERRGKREP